ncbi:MAG: hypothetical protein H8E44_35740 [Planctomycetes bacterium]|nr:hypothetical protein [Planctomycetota bacterium]
MYRKCLFGLMASAMFVCAAPVPAQPPVWEGRPATIYAWVLDPMEIAFDSDGFLYAGHNRNAHVRIYRIPPGGGVAEEWGTRTAHDPDAVDVCGDYVYFSSTRNVWRTHRQTGITGRWTNFSVLRNMVGLVVDAFGDYAKPGDLFIANARKANDIARIDATTRKATPLVSSPHLHIPRGLQFANGKLYCVESQKSKGLWEITPTGDVIRVDDAGFEWGSPSALAYDSRRDAFYVGDDRRGEVVRVPRAGGDAKVVAWGFPKTDPSIAGLTFDEAGNLYASDGVNQVIWKMPPDSTPPTVECLADPITLFPPNHKMVPVDVFIAAEDDVTSPEDLSLDAVFISSNEPDEFVADGDTAGDVNGEDGFLVPVDVTDLFEFDEIIGGFLGTVELRAERAGDGDGRVYTIEAFVSDEAGNIGTSSCDVVVTHDKGKKKK